MLAEIESVDIKPTVKRLELPPLVDSVFEKVRPIVEEMAEEGPEHLAYAAAVDDLMTLYTVTAPKGIIMGRNTCCAGAGVNVPVMNVTYNMERGAAYDPEDFKRRYGHYPKIYKTTAEATVTVGEQTSLGRMGGKTGWSIDRDLVAAALASFRHNWVETLIAYAKRATLPFTGQWQLPNCVLAETREPDQFVPPATFTYSLWRPARRATFYFTVAVATPAKLQATFWDTSKKDMCATEVFEVPEGTNTVAIRLRGPAFTIRAGYFNIEPIDAKQGLTISDVYARPGVR